MCEEKVSKDKEMKWELSLAGATCIVDPINGSCCYAPETGRTFVQAKQMKALQWLAVVLAHRSWADMADDDDGVELPNHRWGRMRPTRQDSALHWTKDQSLDAILNTRRASTGSRRLQPTSRFAGQFRDWQKF